MIPGFQNLHPDGLLVRTRDGRNFKAQEYLEFLAPDGTLYRIVIGGTSDGCSSPPIVWTKLGLPWITPFGPHWLPSYVHDGGFQNWLQKCLPDGTWVKADLNETQANELIAAAMKLAPDPVPEAHQIEINIGLREFGWKAFRDDRAAANPT